MLIVEWILIVACLVVGLMSFIEVVLMHGLLIVTELIPFIWIPSLLAKPPLIRLVI